MIDKKFDLDTPPQHVYNRKKEDYVKIALTPGSASNINRTGDLTFEVDNQASYLYLPKSFLYCEYSLFKDDKFANELKETDNITLEHNFFPKLFDSMRLEVGTQTIETITDPGVFDTMLRFVAISENKVKYENEGWIPDTGSGNYVEQIKFGAVDKFSADEQTAIANRLNKHTKNSGYTKRFELNNRNKAKQAITWSLSPLFGYLDYKKISYQLRYKLVLYRNNRTNELVFFGKAGEKAYIKINKLEWWIPHITPSVKIETMIMQRLNTNKAIPVSFLQRVVSSVDIQENNYTWHFTRTSDTPRFLIVGIQPNEAPKFENNNSKFCSKYPTGEIKSIQVYLNQDRYPIDPLRFDKDNNVYQEGYNAYKQMCAIFGNNAQLSPLDWRNLYSIFCFDLSAQPEDLVKNGCDVTIKIEKSEAIKSFKVYAVAMVDANHFIELNNSRMVRIN